MDLSQQHMDWLVRMEHYQTYLPSKYIYRNGLGVHIEIMCNSILHLHFQLLLMWLHWLQCTHHFPSGQFWNIPVNISSYTGPYGDGTAAPSDRIYSITVAYPDAPERTFIADYGKKDWLDGRPCLYAGNHNGGPIGEVPGSDSVIEGKYSDYEVADLFATDYGFSKFEANC